MGLLERIYKKLFTTKLSFFSKITNQKNQRYLITLMEVKRLKNIRTGGLEKIDHFYLSQLITLHPQNSIFFYLRTYPEWLEISIFSYPLVYPPNEVVSIFFSIFRDRLLISFSIPHLSIPIVQILISLYTEKMFFPRVNYHPAIVNSSNLVEITQIPV